MKTIIAIDPGASGGIAVRYPNGCVAAHKMPETEGDVMGLISLILEGAENPVAYVEVVGGFIKGSPAPGSTMFNFGRGYGFILGVLMKSGVRVVNVRPQVWQKPLGIGTKGGRTTSEWKNKLKGVSQQLFPAIKVINDTADALLILDYAVRAENLYESR